jgi:hypothetical protein
MTPGVGWGHNRKTIFTYDYIGTIFLIFLHQTYLAKTIHIYMETLID